MVEGDGFEPSKAQLTDLQSAPFGHSGIPRHMERMMRIELTPSAWKAEVLPLNYIRRIGAEDEIRTRDPRLGKAMLYP